MPLKEKFRGKNYHISYNSETRVNGEKVLTKDDVQDLQFNNSIAFSAYFETHFTKAFSGQKIDMTIWQSDITDYSLFGNFTFPTMFDWDDFYYDKRN